jgi:dUTPase
MILKCIPIAGDVIIPKYETKGAAGLDLRAYQYSLSNDLEKAYDFPETGLNLKPMERILIRTGLKFEIPGGYEV